MKVLALPLEMVQAVFERGERIWGVLEGLVWVQAVILCSRLLKCPHTGESNLGDVEEVLAWFKVACFR